MTNAICLRGKHAHVFVVEVVHIVFVSYMRCILADMSWGFWRFRLALKFLKALSFCAYILLNARLFGFPPSATFLCE